MLKEYNEGCQAGGSIKMASNPKPPNPFESVASVLSSAQTLATRIECLADRLLGPIFVAGQNSSAEGSINGVLPLMDHDATRTAYRIADANAALDRIEAVLP